MEVLRRGFEPGADAPGNSCVGTSCLSSVGTLRFNNIPPLSLLGLDSRGRVIRFPNAIQLGYQSSRETELTTRQANSPPPGSANSIGARSSPPSPWFPWARLNLWRNPFGELTPEERAELAVFADGDLSRCDVGHGQAVQLIGACGRGKTTRMLAIRMRLPEASYVYLPEDEPCPAIPAGCPLLIDEAQRLPRRVRRQIFSTRLPLVLATHDDLQRVLRRFGYSVRTVWIGSENTPELICRMLNRRIEASRLAEGPLPVVSLQQVNRLVDRFGSDVRAIENFLYEQVQTQVTQNQVTQDGEVRFID